MFPDGPDENGNVESEGISWGCACEGWGVGADGDSIYFNNSDGESPTTAYNVVSFSSSPSTAISTLDFTNGKLRVTHDYHPTSKSNNLYEVTVTLKNTSGGTITDLRTAELWIGTSTLLP